MEFGWLNNNIFYLNISIYDSGIILNYYILKINILYLNIILDLAYFKITLNLF